MNDSLVTTVLAPTLQKSLSLLPRLSVGRLGLCWLFMLTTSTQALVRLGEPLPSHHWPELRLAKRAVVVIYAQDCDEIGSWWPRLRQEAVQRDWPIFAVGVSTAGIASAGVNGASAQLTKQGVKVWRGVPAQAFATALRAKAYPAVIVSENNRVLYAWEGTYAQSVSGVSRSGVVDAATKAKAGTIPPNTLNSLALLDTQPRQAQPTKQVP